MRKLFIFIFCLVLASCAGTRTLDGETTKNWVKIVSSKIDRAGNVEDVCFLLDLSFYPGTVYERIKNNPNSCLEECCWYSENKTVEYYFNDGFLKDLKEKGVSRRYVPDHIKIKMKYAPFLNRLSARAESYNGISKDGVVTLEYDDIDDSDIINDDSFSEFKAKAFPEDPKEEKQKSSSYKTTSMSGANHDELLARAKKEQGEYYKKEIAIRYESPEREYVEESIAFTNQVSPFEKQDNETKWITSKKTLEEEAKAKNYNIYPERYGYKYQAKLREKNRQLNEQRKQLDEEKKQFDEERKQFEKEKLSKEKQELKEKAEAEKQKLSDQQKQLGGKVDAEKQNLTDKQKQLNEKLQDPMYDVQRPASKEMIVAEEGTELQKAVIVSLKNNKEEVKDDKTLEEKLEEAQTLKKKLTYERTQAVDLLKRFYGDEIDGYLRALDKEKREEGKILFTNDKVWQAKKVGTTIYTIDCNVRGQIITVGDKSKVQAKKYPIPCGTYLVNLDEKTVEAKDTVAKNIAKKKY